MDTSNDQTIDYAEAAAVIAALSAVPDWALSIVDTCRGRGGSLNVRRRITGRFEVTIPPTVRWSELVSTLALLSLLVDAEDLLSAPGDDLARAQRIAEDGIADAARTALDSYRAAAPTSVFS